MKPIYEDIRPSFGSSFAFRRFNGEQCSNLPYWHCHPEYEITFISNGRGKRHIGDHISYYDEGDLVFLGPNIPHMDFSQEVFEDHYEIVVQMKEDFLGPHFLDVIEMGAIKELFERAKSGLVFYGATKWDIGERLSRMVDMNSFDRLLELLRVLNILAYSPDCYSLNLNHQALEIKPQEKQRIRAIYDFIEQNYQRQFSLEEVAEQVNMTVPAFCRFFKKHTHKTFVAILNEYRIARACALLGEEHANIANVGYECGFNNLSHFNKQFRLYTGKTPTGYRKHLKKFMVAPKKVGSTEQA
ncbi:MAG: AraC family transcriptional regulator [Saprospiraceae bacterium]